MRDNRRRLRSFSGVGALEPVALAFATLAAWQTVLVRPAIAQTYSVLYSFQCGPADGSGPTSGVVADNAGNLYGITNVGGTYGLGTIYKFTANGTEAVLHNFAGPPADGTDPVGAPVMDAQGNLYGMTQNGGNDDVGTIYELTPAATESVLYSFGNYGGQEPESSLLLDPVGNLYGTTLGGGEQGHGTVFKLSSSGKESTLYDFRGGMDGWQPDYAVSQRKRKRVEQSFGWMKTIGLLRKVKLRGREKVGWWLKWAGVAYNLVRLRNLQAEAMA